MQKAEEAFYMTLAALREKAIKEVLDTNVLRAELLEQVLNENEALKKRIADLEELDAVTRQYINVLAGNLVGAVKILENLSE